MRQFAILTFILACTAWAGHAQTFTQHLQLQGASGKAMTVSQSKEIDELVNHADVSRDTKPSAASGKAEATKRAAHGGNNKEKAATESPEKPKTAAEKPKAGTTASATDDGMDIPTVDMRKKVMRRSYKVNGYRVQVFAGGNSRNDKQKAHQAGDNVKMAFPDIPVYVHFYSPRWICRMGNFRTYEEANSVLRQVRELGYKQACIVSGKITVAY